MPYKIPPGYKHPKNNSVPHAKPEDRLKDERVLKQTADLASLLSPPPLGPMPVHPCKERCQYAVDIGMPEHHCSDGCMYDRVHGEE